MISRICETGSFIQNLHFSKTSADQNDEGK
jgi:hypothetical protein